MELNPNHPTTRMISDHWHKLAAILMVKLDVDHVVITSSDIARMDPGTAIVYRDCMTDCTFVLST